MKNMQFLLKLLTGSVIATTPFTSVIACSSETNADISSGVLINSLQVAADSNSTYDALNTNKTLTSAVANAINSAKNVNVELGTDFTISNDQIANAKQSIGQTIKFTVTARGTQITGEFNFIETLSKPSISNGIKLNDLNTPVDPQATFDRLNVNTTIVEAVENAIQQTLGIVVTAGTDFIINNNQIPDALQIAGTPITFTVIAISNKITGSFQFVDTLTGLSIASGVKVNDLQTTANPALTYSALNSDSNIKSAVAFAINNAKKTKVSGSDFTLTNNQIGNQVAGTTVLFTVTGNGTKIKDSFTFTDTLTKTNISTGVVVKDLETPTDPTTNYSSLNLNSDIINAIVKAINTAKGTTITANDFTLSNNKTGNQSANTPVLFTVTGTGNKITGSFNFVDTLGRISIASGVALADPNTAADTGATYGALNSNAGLLTAVVNAINSAKGTTITTNDITLTNNQTATAAQVAGTPVTFTVTAIRGQIKDSFMFVNTLSKANISTGITIPDLGLSPTLNATYGALNNNAVILNTILTTINATKNTNITASDIVLTNNQTSSANQVPNTPVTFTVAAAATSTQITGSFNFIMTLAKINISTGVSVADLATTVINGTFGSLNTNTTILNAVVNAINTAKGTTITANDITLTNNQATNTQMTAGIVIFTVMANPTSTQIVGSFNFYDTLTKVNITGINIPATFTIKADTTKLWGSLTINPQLMAFIVDAIRGYRGITVSTIPNVDIYITTNLNNQATQAASTNFTITATAVPTSNLITGSFTFSGYTNA